MSGPVSTWSLDKFLKEEGYPLPDETVNVRLVMGVDAALMLQFDVFITPENLVKLSNALKKMAEEAMK